MKQALVFEASRTGYGINQIQNAFTVGQLREMLEGLEDDMIVILSHDNGYTYGTLSRNASIREEKECEYGIEYEEVDEAWL